MEICIVSGGMPSGPHTLKYASLGGSETAAIMLGLELRKLGHEVILCTNLPKPPAPDAFPSGFVDDSGVRWIDLSQAQAVLSNNEFDLAIVSRDPGIASWPIAAKKKVLWMHDVATKRFGQRVLDQVKGLFDEIWAVSEWHRKQINDATGYPLSHIKVLPNGIVPVDVQPPKQREQKTILYAARPERGLENLVKQFGIMEHLPDYKLLVCTYNHFPADMQQFYNYIFDRAAKMPNVEFLGSLRQQDLRQKMTEVAAYIYPTQFAETSCVLARECISTGLPVCTTREGALPETLGDCGVYFEDWLAEFGIEQPEPGSDGWCKLFAQFFRECMANESMAQVIAARMARRTDLYWDRAAKLAVSYSEPKQPADYSRIWSLIQDGDVVPAIAYTKHCLLQMPSSDLKADLLNHTLNELRDLYPFLFDNGVTLADHYEKIYTSRPAEETELRFRLDGSERVNQFAQRLKDLPDGARVLEWGCGPGHVIGPLAKMFPRLRFVGTDVSSSCVKLVNDASVEHKLDNLSAVTTEGFVGADFDAVICTEVLEHVPEPWVLATQIECYCKPGGMMLLSVPYGAWEPDTWRKRWEERCHIWHIDKWMIKKMFGSKPELALQRLMAGMKPDGRTVGQTVIFYRPDYKPIEPISQLDKALRANSRETCAAAVIAYNNEDTILRMLNSIENEVHFVQIALGPCTDNTEQVVDMWFKSRPWLSYRIIRVPKIEPGKFSFADARNRSIEGLDTICDWILWIDTDEYLSGSITKYLRPSACDGYMIPQHHFTVFPRQAPAEMDMPVRLMRADRGYLAKGRIHEHFEIPAGGPGHVMCLPDVDIGHIGYVNEPTRRSRFERNWPFLKWDHENGGAERGLHKFLWFRDIVHRMRFEAEQGRRHNVIRLAKEGEQWYKDNFEQLMSFGSGAKFVLAYLAEIYAALGKRTVPIKFMVAFDDSAVELNGSFESLEQFQQYIGHILKGPMSDRLDRFW